VRSRAQRGVSNHETTARPSTSAQERGLLRMRSDG
jgi:hypothetical protein